MERIVVNINAKSKIEAINALEILLETIKNTKYDGQVIESVIVNDEGRID